MAFIRYSTPQKVYAKLTPVAGGLAFSSSYDSGLISAFKLSIPSSARKWDAGHKYWIVDSSYAQECVKLAQTFLGVQIAIPTQATLNMPPQVETKLIKLEYLGRCKERGIGDLSATGFVNGGWNVIFPEMVLREWFEAVPQQPDEKPTLYAVLGVKTSVTADELKSAYRRMARQWHPDVCKEPNATEQFKIINRAYEMLSSPIVRQRYDAGLILEAKMKEPVKQSISDVFHHIYSPDGQLMGYRAPLFCGWLLVEGVEMLGRLTINKILGWEDVVNSEGKVMVASWPLDAKTFEVNWC